MTSNRSIRRVAAAILASAALSVGLLPQSTSLAAPLGGKRVDLVLGREKTAGSLNFRSRNADEGDCTLAENCLGGLGRRRTLEFDTVVINQGTDALELGNPRNNPLFEYSPCHMHYHLKGSLEYSISHGGSDSIALLDGAGAVSVRDANADGSPDASYALAPPAAGAIAISGDWDGDGDSTLGYYDPASSRFSLTNTKSPAGLEIAFKFRPSRAALRPIAGDWDGDGKDSVGLFDAATRTVYLRNALSKGAADATFAIDVGTGDWVAIAGDWDGDDVDSTGLYNAATNTFALRNTNSAGGPDASFSFGAPGAQPIAGDWDRDGRDSIGTYDSVTGRVELRNALEAGEPDAAFTVESGLIAVAGDWDYDAGVPLAALGHKQSFCWLDTQRFAGNSDAHFRTCDGTMASQGLSAGWGDLYVRGTDCQWLDITGVPAGNYQLRVGVNDSRAIPETDYTNNAIYVKVHIPTPRTQALPAKVRVVSPTAGESFRVGEPVTVRWKVDHPNRVTRQELWLYHAHEGHINEAVVLDANIPAGARSYTWVPTADFVEDDAVFVVRAQDERNNVGSDAKAKGSVRISQE